MKAIIKQIKQDVLELFPENTTKSSQTYCTRNWIFPNHFEPMIQITKDLCLKYGGNQDICEIACLLHDTGLVYLRNKESPEGHESNSLKFAKKTLLQYNFKEEQIDVILKCIEATELDYEPNSINEKIVRSADILSQYYSIHFFAKAHFYPDWNMYLRFLEKKVTKGFDKICFDDEREEAKPIRDYLQKVLLEYKKYNCK